MICLASSIAICFACQRTGKRMQVLLNDLNFSFNPRLGSGHAEAIIGKTEQGRRSRIQLICFLKIAANHCPNLAVDQNLRLKN